MNYRTKAIPVTATQWLREGDHPAVTGCTRRWAEEGDNPDFVTDKEFAAAYDKPGMIHMGSISPSGVVVEAGNWIVEEEGEEIEVYTDEMFRKYFEATATAQAQNTQAVLTPGPVDGEGAPVAETAPSEAAPAPESAPVANDPAPVNPSPAPAP